MQSPDFRLNDTAFATLVLSQHTSAGTLAAVAMAFLLSWRTDVVAMAAVAMQEVPVLTTCPLLSSVYAAGFVSGEAAALRR